MLRESLQQKRGDILKQWFALICESYSPDAARFMKRESDRFANPAGSNIYQSIHTLFDQLCEDADPRALGEAGEMMIKLRAVQDFTPSEAVGIIFVLKDVLRNVLKQQLSSPECMSEYLDFESRIDRAALAAFDLYMVNRESLFQIKLREAKNRIARVYQRPSDTIQVDKPSSGRGSSDE